MEQEDEWNPEIQFGHAMDPHSAQITSNGEDHKWQALQGFLVVGLINLCVCRYTIYIMYKIESL